MKKVEKKRQLVAAHRDLYRCPVCHRLIQTVDQSGIVCENGHRIDFNKHGYLHFLNGAADTEYGREMFVARRQLLSAGLFLPIVRAMAAHLPARPQRILDVGTGEGTPLLQLAQQRPGQDDCLVGFDISKAGITLATQLDLAAFFCVADLRQLPFNDDSFDVVMELFSPSDYAEFNRVLAPGGTLLKVIPNSDYLIELRHLLYGTADNHSHYDNSRVRELFFKHYPQASLERVRYQFTIPDGLQQALVEMTPLHWGKGAKRLSDGDLAALHSVTVDVSLLVAQKNS
ncbi:methyltransferase domain-containing protein [Limosilactobacillus sp.]|uniref:methyltransferase domain-containing protein n=1 Tax=Limosilactobacillus sp. TaxID=2773925 RepID=UPI0025BE54E8|nr:methyltransferase domain-containing protein [Limosilactobacillus sp.]MCH3922490.1 methyltransferase domain-containing protein [Limosilactobacillus sp.]MCH3927172.1 methyltransferase domain-containing protein [Limosilactobacillus sp.]